jgi:putative sigma-54 modulation protein
MRLKLSGKQVNITDGIRNHASDRSEKFNKFLKGRFNVSWVFQLEGSWHNATVVISGKNFVHRAEGRTTNLYSSIDMACQKIERQLVKTKERVKDRRADKTNAQSFEELDLFKKAG